MTIYAAFNYSNRFTILQDTLVVDMGRGHVPAGYTSKALHLPHIQTVVGGSGHGHLMHDMQLLAQRLSYVLDGPSAVEMIAGRIRNADERASDQHVFCSYVGRDKTIHTAYFKGSAEPRYLGEADIVTNCPEIAGKLTDETEFQENVYIQRILDLPTDVRRSRGIGGSLIRTVMMPDGMCYQQAVANFSDKAETDAIAVRHLSELIRTGELPISHGAINIMQSFLDRQE